MVPAFSVKNSCLSCLFLVTFVQRMWMCAFFICFYGIDQLSESFFVDVYHHQTVHTIVLLILFTSLKLVERALV